MRTFVGCLLVLASGLLTAQTSEGLLSRYQEPDRERFSPRSGIALTVEYGTDGWVCRALVEQPRPLFRTADQALFMPSDLVTEISEEVVPLASRTNETGAYSRFTRM